MPSIKFHDVAIIIDAKAYVFCVWNCLCCCYFYSLLLFAAIKFTWIHSTVMGISSLRYSIYSCASIFISMFGNGSAGIHKILSAIWVKRLNDADDCFLEAVGKSTRITFTVNLLFLFTLYSFCSFSIAVSFSVSILVFTYLTKFYGAHKKHLLAQL